MLSDSPHKKIRRPPNKKKVTGRGVGYSDAQKMDLVKLYLVTGNLMASAATLNVPYQTAKTWKKSDWFKELTTDIKTEDTIVLSSNLKQIVNRTLEITKDRLEHGDWMWDQKRGELIRRPVSLKDAHKVTVDLIDRRQQLENRPDNATNIESVEQRLLAIASKFESIAKSKPIVEVTDVIIGTSIESHA